MGWSWKDQLSTNFTYGEMTASSVAARKNINNVPDDEHVDSMIHLCKNVLEPIRKFYNRPVLVTSGYRSPKLNEEIGGSDNSQHMRGEAADFIVHKSEIDNVFQAVCDTSLPFDQIIWEYGRWIHVSHTDRRENRNQILITRKIRGGLEYVEYEREDVISGMYLKDIEKDSE